MSVFSKIMMSKKVAKQHKEKVKEKQAEPPRAPYRHVPTHAAFDALSGAPSSWSHGDRPKIQAQHKRRSQMAVSRTESSLSVAYMNAATSIQAHPLPRTSSYNSHNPTWFDREGTNYSYEKSEPVAKRYKPSRGHSFHDSGVGSSVGPSPLASNVQSEAEASPVMSSGNSTNSNSSENLEMARHNRQSMRPQPTMYADQNIFDKLHTSTTRKLGEAPLYDSPPVHKTPVVTAPAVSPQKQKKRWSLLGKKNAISAI